MTSKHSSLVIVRFKNLLNTPKFVIKSWECRFLAVRKFLLQTVWFETIWTLQKPRATNTRNCVHHKRRRCTDRIEDFACRRKYSDPCDFTQTSFTHTQPYLLKFGEHIEMFLIFFSFCGHFGVPFSLVTRDVGTFWRVRFHHLQLQFCDEFEALRWFLKRGLFFSSFNPAPIGLEITLKFHTEIQLPKNFSRTTLCFILKERISFSSIAFAYSCAFPNREDGNLYKQQRHCAPPGLYVLGAVTCLSSMLADLAKSTPKDKFYWFCCLLLVQIPVFSVGKKYRFHTHHFLTYFHCVCCGYGAQH